MTDQMIVPESGQTVYFDAELRPHRSLGPSGFLIVMSLATGFGFVIGVTFMLVGAWPVLGFCGLEILALYIAFRLNYRSGRRRERIYLTEKGLQIQFTAPDGRVDIWEVEPSWLRVAVENTRRRGGRITLSTHGDTAVIGKFLSPAERTEVARGLRAAIERYRAAPLAAC